MSFVFDLLLVGLILAMVLRGRKKGFVKSSYTVLSIVISIILLMTLQQPITDYLKESPLGDAVRDRIEMKVITQADEEAQTDSDSDSLEKIANEMKLPHVFSDFIVKSVNEGTATVETMKQDVLEVLTDSITETILKIASFVILFVLVRLLTSLVLNSLNIVMKLPVLASINGMLGMIIGALNGVLLAYILCSALTLLAPTETISSIGEIVDKTLFVRYFYNNNLLLRLFI